MFSKTNRAFFLLVIVVMSVLSSQVFGKLAEKNNNKNYSKSTLESLLSKSDKQFWNNIQDWWQRTIIKLNETPEKAKNAKEKIIEWFKKW